MALFDNVTYTYYTDTLERSTVPDADTFNDLRLRTCALVQSLVTDGLIVERAENGITNACCMMIEEDYKAEAMAAGKGSMNASETIGGYSHSINTKAADLQAEKDAKSTAEKKYFWLKTYCHVMGGVR